MSERSIFRCARGFLLEKKIQPDVLAVILSALNATKASNVQFFWELGSDAGLEVERLRGRCLALLFLFAWSNLTDDLVDQEASYLRSPEKAGPIVLYALRCLADVLGLERGGLSTEAWFSINQDLAKCAFSGFEEIREVAWDLPRWLDVAQGIAGMQFSAYLRVLWSGTRLEKLSQEVGYRIGFLSHFYHDQKSLDKRLYSLQQEEIAKIETKGKEYTQWLRACAKEHEIHGLFLYLGM